MKFAYFDIYMYLIDSFMYMYSLRGNVENDNRVIECLSMGVRMGYLYPYLPPDLLLCRVATVPNSGVL